MSLAINAGTGTFTQVLEENARKEVLEFYETYLFILFLKANCSKTYEIIKGTVRSEAERIYLRNSSPFLNKSRYSRPINILVDIAYRTGLPEPGVKETIEFIKQLKK